MTPHEMTRMALMEGGHLRIVAALDAIGPNGAGDPPIGALGFMAPGDCEALCRAADLAHRHAATDGWEPMSIQARARFIARSGSWLRHFHRPEFLAARMAYKAAVLAEPADAQEHRA